MTPRPLRVAVDGRALQPGFREHQGRGIGVYAVELVRALARRDDVALTLWHQPELPLPPEHVPAGAAVRAYPRLGLPSRDRLAVFSTVPAALRGSDHDVFHFLAHSDAPPWGTSRVVVTVHDLILDVMANLYAPKKPLAYRVVRALERRAVIGAAAVATDSEVTRRDVIARLGRDPASVHVAHLGLDARFAPPGERVLHALRERLGLERPYVLYLGGIDARKNVPGLLRAYAAVRKADSDAPDLAIAGRVLEAPEFPPLLDLVRALKIEPHVKFTGFVPDSDLPALHAGARAFAFPSLYEGFGFPPLEAMACGTPVVSSGGGSLAEVLGDGALVVPPGDDDALAAGLGRVLRDEGLRADLVARGRANAARFSWERCAAATVAAYEQVSNGSARR